MKQNNETKPGKYKRRVSLPATLFNRGAINRLGTVLSGCWDAGFAAAAVVGPVAGEAGGVYGADALSTLAQRCGRQRGGGGGG